MPLPQPIEDSSPRFRLSLEAHPLRAVLLVSLAVPLYFLLLGYFGDDYAFHLSSWMGVLQDWRFGVFLPAWYAPANFGLGEPRFYFYPPLSFALGAILLAVFPARVVPALVPWMAVIVAGLSMLKLARRLVPQRAAQAALLYCTSYYLVLTLVMRYAVAEALVTAVLPLIVHFTLRLFQTDRFVSAALVATLVFAWLTNLPAALVIFYVVLLSSILVAILQRSPSALMKYLLAQALAIGISAWYLLPAAWAKDQLTASGLTAKFPWRDYTLFHHPRNPLARSLTYPLWLWAIVGFAVVLWIALRQRQTSRPGTTLFLASLGCIPLFFELPQSALLWSLPEVKLIAFSFRFLPFLALALAVFLPQIRSAALRRAAYALWIIWMLLPVAERIGRSHVHGAPPTFATAAAEIDRGTAAMSEYLPAGVTEAPVSATEAQPPLPGDICTATTLRWTPQARRVVTHSKQPCLYEAGLFFFPEWHATIDSLPAPVHRSPTGRLQLTAPAGDHRIDLNFERPARPLLLGAALTLLALILLTALTLWQQASPEEA